jgi:hypothetical protein
VTAAGGDAGELRDLVKRVLDAVDRAHFGRERVPAKLVELLLPVLGQAMSKMSCDSSRP